MDVHLKYSIVSYLNIYVIEHRQFLKIIIIIYRYLLDENYNVIHIIRYIYACVREGVCMCVCVCVYVCDQTNAEDCSDETALWFNISAYHSRIRLTC